MNSRTTSLSLLALACVVALLAPAVAGNADPDATTGYHTAWVQPIGRKSSKAGAQNAGLSEEDDKTCVWDYFIGPRIIDDRTHDPTYGWCGSGTTDAYAHAVADGMQVFAYGWAYDSCIGGDAGAAISASSSGEVSVFARKVPAGCSPRIAVDWMPRVRLRVHQSNPPGTAEAAVEMTGDVRELAFNIRIAGAFKADSEASVSEAGGSIMLAGTGGGLQIPVALHRSTAPREATLEDNQAAWAAITEATATFVGRTRVSASADASIWNWVGESEAWVWDSRPGLDLHGECPAPCAGFAYVVYGWPLPL